MTSYKTVRQAASDEYVVNKSRFIGQACPCQTEEEALSFIRKVREKYRDATHNCYAYVIGENAGIMRYSDDGEPGGTAGMPMMEVLRGAGVTDVLCVVTRYFGGILLGTGGLVRAYGRTCSEAIQAAGVVRMVPCDLVRFEVPYPQWSLFQQVSRKHEADLVPEYEGVIRCVAAVEAARTDAFLRDVFDQSAGTLNGTVAGREYRSKDENEKA